MVEVEGWCRDDVKEEKEVNKVKEAQTGGRSRE
jgi:hypothetical protein